MVASVDEAHMETVASSDFFLLSFSCGSEDGIQGLAHPRQVLYHGATSPGLNEFSFDDTSHSYAVLSPGTLQGHIGY